MNPRPPMVCEILVSTVRLSDLISPYRFRLKLPPPTTLRSERPVGVLELTLQTPPLNRLVHPPRLVKLRMFVL